MNTWDGKKNVSTDRGKNKKNSLLEMVLTNSLLSNHLETTTDSAQFSVLEINHSLETVRERSSVWGGIYLSTVLITRFTSRVKIIQKKKKKKAIT